MTPLGNFNDYLKSIQDMNKKKPVNYTTFTAIDLYRAMIEQQELEEERIKNGYYIHSASVHEKIMYMINYLKIAANEKQEFIDKLHVIITAQSPDYTEDELNSLLDELSERMKRLGE